MGKRGVNERIYIFLHPFPFCPHPLVIMWWDPHTLRGKKVSNYSKTAVSKRTLLVQKLRFSLSFLSFFKKNSFAGALAY